MIFFPEKVNLLFENPLGSGCFTGKTKMGLDTALYPEHYWRQRQEEFWGLQRAASLATGSVRNLVGRKHMHTCLHTSTLTHQTHTHTHTHFALPTIGLE